MSESSTLSDDSIKWLTDLGENPIPSTPATSASSSGSPYRVKRRRIREPSGDNIADNEVFSFPRKLYSVEAFEFCGFTPNAAKKLCDALGSQYDRVYELLRRRTLLCNGPDADSESCDEDWLKVLLSLGLRCGVIDGIMASSFEDIRLSQTAKYWAFDTVHALWVFMSGCEKLIQGQKQHAAGGTYAEAAAKTIVSSPAKATTPTKSTLNAPGPRSRRDRVSDSEPMDAPTMEIMKQPLKVKDGEYELYKGGDLGRLELGLATEFIVENKRLPLEEILTSPGGDFNAQGDAFYLTSQYATAERYAAYFLRRTENYSPAAILRFSVPLDILRGDLEIMDLKDWSEFVFGCRKKNPDVPLVKKWKNKAVIRGYICGTAYRVGKQLKGPHQVRRMQLPDGSYATQVVLNADRTNDLAKVCVNKVQVIDVRGTRELFERVGVSADKPQIFSNPYGSSDSRSTSGHQKSESSSSAGASNTPSQRQPSGGFSTPGSGGNAPLGQRGSGGGGNMSSRQRGSGGRGSGIPSQRGQGQSGSLGSPTRGRGGRGNRGGSPSWN